MKKVRLCIELSEESAEILRALGAVAQPGTTEEVLHYVACSLLDGVRRPGSWERQLLYPLFGEEGIEAAQLRLLGRGQR